MDILALSQHLKTYRFDKAKCDAAGLLIYEAEMLSALLAEPRPGTWVHGEYGLSVALSLQKRGLVTNDGANGSGWISRADITRSNSWMITDKGISSLSDASGFSR